MYAQYRSNHCIFTPIPWRKLHFTMALITFLDFDWLNLWLRSLQKLKADGVLIFIVISLGDI